MTLAPPRTRAVLIPDQAHWASAGLDLAELGIEPVASLAQAQSLVVPRELPPELAEALAEARLRLGDAAPPRVIETSVVAGRPVDGLLAGGHGDREHHGGHDHDHGGEPATDGEHGPGHDQHDMMAVTGDPSRDGLVMEAIDTELGPLAPSLPTGLVIQTALDGDVVSKATVEATLVASEGPPDPLARAAWAWVEARAAAGPELAPARVARHLAATEIERALSHLMWLVRFAVLLGWIELADVAERAARPLITAHLALTVKPSVDDAELPAPHAVERAASLAGGSRMGRRTRSLGRIDAAECRERGLAGPLARASGLSEDLRADDPAYEALGFDPHGRDGGDAEARVTLRGEEAVSALRLARAALAAGELPAAEPAAVEGPRGPLAVRPEEQGAKRHFARGTAAGRKLAGELTRGLELAPALALVASFDLSPWRVSG